MTAPELDVQEINWGDASRTTHAPPRASESRVEIAEPFSVFCARLQQRVRPADIVPGLIPGIGITMAHGHPRTLKTWVALEIARAIVTGDAAFGLERFRIEAPRPTWYLTEEDPELDVRDRLMSIFAGRQQASSELLHVSVQRALTLDDNESQINITSYAAREQMALTIIDPVRSMSAAVDQGPRELRPLARFLRFYMRETGSAVLLVHHDVKPLNGKPDDRARPHRASGGGIFSIADSPIHTEALEGDCKTLVTPSLYKFAVAPAPFTVTFEADDPKQPTWVRLVGEEATAGTAAEISLHARIAAFLRENPGTSGSKVAVGLRAEKSRVLAGLEALLRKGEADFYQKGQGKYWTARGGAV